MTGFNSNCLFDVKCQDTCSSTYKSGAPVAIIMSYNDYSKHLVLQIDLHINILIVLPENYFTARPYFAASDIHSQFS